VVKKVEICTAKGGYVVSGIHAEVLAYNHETRVMNVVARPPDVHICLTWNDACDRAATMFAEGNQ
jgi:hypothetical protein